MTFRPRSHTTPRWGWSLPTRRRAVAVHDDSLRAGVHPHRAPTSLIALAHGFSPR